MICPEEEVWKSIDPDDIWVLDKFILARKLGYICGPVGMDVLKDDWYILRPCKNALGLGLGASIEYLKADWGGTDHLTPGYFWCEIFSGRHLSVDYNWGIQRLCVEGKKPDNTLTRWEEWTRIQESVPFPEVLGDYASKYEWINCEFIDGNLIEVHFRHNQDFAGGVTHFIPVWEGEDTNPPDGYKYIEYPDIHGRIGAYVRV